MSVVDSRREVALMLTRRCNMACGHCSVESGPHVREEPSQDDLLELVRQAASAGVRWIRLTGGEPMIRMPIVLRLLRECQRLGVNTTISTNGFWGRDPRAARRHVRALRRAGIGTLAVSYDRYHAEFQNLAPVQHIARAAARERVPVSITLTRIADDPQLTDIVEQFRDLPFVQLRFYDVQPVGRARTLPPSSLRSEVEGFCAACAAPSITDDGRVIACNGPAYFADERSPLHVGKLRDHSLAELLDRHASDPILETIRTAGPAGLRDELRRLPGFEGFPFRRRYFGICDLCQHITADPGAVDALRAALSQPSRVALQRAAAHVITAGRQRGPLTSRYVNGAGAAGTFLRAASAQDGRWPTGSERILGRADLDWNHWAEYLGACGLARPLLTALDAPDLSRWAPTFFAERLRALALRDSFTALVQREATRRIGQVLAELDAHGVVLKGMALALREAEVSPSRLPRATGDVDVYVEPRIASRLRDRLIETGFTGEPGAPAQAPHHLAGVEYRGVLVEIHTRLVPPFWGLPERDMLARTLPLAGSPRLVTLSAEGLVLHAAVHTAQDSFSHGLKTAWDGLAALRVSSELDWDVLARWIAATRAPRGIWAVLGVLVRELEIGVPARILAQAPRDERQRRLETIARRRLFRVAESPDALDPLSRQAIRFLMHDSWIAFGGYLASQVAVRRGRTVAWRGTVGRATRVSLVRSALIHWRQYRRAIRESARRA